MCGAAVCDATNIAVPATPCGAVTSVCEMRRCPLYIAESFITIHSLSMTQILSCKILLRPHLFSAPLQLWSANFEDTPRTLLQSFLQHPFRCGALNFGRYSLLQSFLQHPFSCGALNLEDTPQNSTAEHPFSCGALNSLLQSTPSAGSSKFWKILL